MSVRIAAVDVRGEGFFQSFARRQQRAAGDEADERARSHSGTGDMNE
jgi:hypothetical protein